MEKKYTRLTLAEREKISQGIYAMEKNKDIALRLGRDPSTISREIKKQIKKKDGVTVLLKDKKLLKKIILRKVEKRNY